jgi:hypothetical protein
MTAQTTTQTPVMQTRLNAAIKRLSTKVGKNEAANGGIVITSCPKPKSATGTADRVRKELASGRLTGLPEGYAIKSRKADVVVTISANFHPWDRDAIAARKAEAGNSTKSVKKAAAKPTNKVKNVPARPRIRRRAKATA